MMPLQDTLRGTEGSGGSFLCFSQAGVKDPLEEKRFKMPQVEAKLMEQGP